MSGPVPGDGQVGGADGGDRGPERAGGGELATRQPAVGDGAGGPEIRRRPLIERIGLALIAVVLALLFGAVAAAAWLGGEVFLAAMGAIGCLMTLWVGSITLFRG